MNLEEARNNIGAEVEVLGELREDLIELSLDDGLYIADVNKHDKTVIIHSKDDCTVIKVKNLHDIKLKPQNYKIHVSTEEESREAQELFFELGYGWKYSAKKLILLGISDYNIFTDGGNIMAGSKIHERKNKQITIQDLRDMVAKKKGIKSIGVDLASGEDKTIRVMGLFQDFEPRKEMTWEDALRAVADDIKVEFYNELCEQWWDISHLSATEVVRIEKFRIAPKRIYLNGNFTKEELMQKIGEME